MSYRLRLERIKQRIRGRGEYLSPEQEKRVNELVERLVLKDDLFRNLLLEEAKRWVRLKTG